MKTKNIIIFLIFFLPFQLFSQNINKALKLIEEEQFKEALAILKKAQKKKKDPIAVKYAKALISMNENYRKTNYIKAFKYFTSVERKLARSKETDKIEKKYNISAKVVRQKKNEVSEKAFLDIKKENSIAKLNTFINIYKNTSAIPKAKKERNKLQYFKIEEINTPAAYKDYFTTYPDSEYASKAKEKYNKAWQKLYYEHARYGELNILKNFKIRYPDYPYFDTKFKADMQLAQEAEGLDLDKGYIAENKTKYIEYIKKAAPYETAYIALLRLIEPYLYKKNWSKAISILNTYKKYFMGEDKRITQLVKILQAKTENLQTKSIGNIINTNKQEYAASLTADGKTIYFCGRDRPDNLAPGQEDIFTAKKVNGKWTKPVLAKNINTPEKHEAPLSISGDGNRMLLYSGADIYYSDKNTDGWTPIRRFPNINKADYWEADAMLTNDGNAIIFISDRRGNIGSYHPFNYEFHGKMSGNTDIYVSERTATGWSQPINLGSVINTPYTERSPYLHLDMKTLYFSSDGHAGLGSLDVFMSKRLSDTSWTEWSEPVNLGKAINTPAEEYDYEISTDGTTAYFSSRKGDSYDIFYTILPKKIRPETVSTISGKITDKNGKQLHVTIKWENLETGETVGEAKNDPNTGNYMIILPDGKNYGFFVEKEGYYSYSGNIDLENKKSVEIKKDIILISEAQIINKEVAVPLSNIFFETNKFELKPESFPELKRLGEFLKAHRSLSVEISGHTDNVGSAVHNKTLSQKRADAVKNYLKSQGFDVSKITTKGYGSEKPIAKNNTKDGKAKNRRVEFRIK